MGRTMKISKEDYLETILVCTNKLGACRVTDIAAHLGHSKASVSVALSKLENEGLIIKDVIGCCQPPYFLQFLLLPTSSLHYSCPRDDDIRFRDNNSQLIHKLCGSFLWDFQE